MNYRYCKSGKGTYIDGIRISKAMIQQIGKEDKTQELTEDDIVAIKSLPLFKRLLERKEQREKMENERRKWEAEAAASEAKFREDCKRDLIGCLPVLKKLSGEFGIKKLTLSQVPHPEGCYTSADVDIEKLCRYAGKKAVEILTESLLSCYIGATGGFNQDQGQYYCADEMRDIYGFDEEEPFNWQGWHGCQNHTADKGDWI